MFVCTTSHHTIFHTLHAITVYVPSQAVHCSIIHVGTLFIYDQMLKQEFSCLSFDRGPQYLVLIAPHVSQQGEGPSK